MGNNKTTKSEGELLRDQILEVLREVEDLQINLKSKEAKINIANKIISVIRSKFYLVPFASQESFE